MHNLATIHRPHLTLVPASRPRREARPVVRAAAPADVAEIHELVSRFAADRLMLPRTESQIALGLDGYVVVADAHDRVLACAALDEYSPSLAEVSSVAVDPSRHGEGLGSAAVLGVERVARRRGIAEIFALTLADGFFGSLGYEKTDLVLYPDKLARYEALRSAGVQVVPKSCFRKIVGDN